MVAWPGSLPQDVLVDGYDETFPNGKLRTQMDQGPAKQRRRYTAAVRPLRVMIEGTRAQMAILDDFYVTTLAMGALTFTKTMPRTLATVTFRFVSQPPKPVPASGNSWAAMLDLEILP